MQWSYKWDKPVVVSCAYPVFTIDESRVLPEYLYRILVSEEFKKKLKDNMSGTARAKIPFEVLQMMEIPLLPISEQKSILDDYKKIIKLKEDIKIVENNINFQLKSIWESKN